VAEISIMMNVDSGTTAIAVTKVIYQLTKNAKVLRRVTEEVDTAVEDDEDEHESGMLAYDKVKHFPYLQACLDESLLLFLPKPHDLPRETPPDGTSILGHYVTGGVTVSMSALITHRQESVFPQADKCNPESYLGEEGKALQPFFLSSPRAPEVASDAIPRT
jgi:cytochrome P450